MNENFDKTIETTSTPGKGSIERNASAQLSENAMKVDDIIKRLESGQWKFNDKIDLNPLTENEFGKIVEAANRSPYYVDLTFTNLTTFNEGMAQKLSQGNIQTITFEKFNPNGEAFGELKKAMDSLSNIKSNNTNIRFNFPDLDMDDVDFVKGLTANKLFDRSIGIKNPSHEMITALMTRNVINEENGEKLDTHYSPFLTLPHLENLSKESANTLLTCTKECNSYPTIELGLKEIPEDFASNEECKAMWTQLLQIPGCLKLPNITSIPDNLAIGITNSYAEGAFLQLPNCTLTPLQKNILNEASRRIQAKGFEK